jgi:hypothetical protein
MSSYPNSIPRCEHLKVNGTQCGSPALKRNHFCFFHKRWHETRIVLNANRARRGRAALDLPVLEDANSIQVSLMQVMRLILSGQVDPKTAGLLLYALQTASSNLSRINFEPAVKTRVVIDPRTVDQTPLGEDPWCREDFEEEEYEEEDQAETDQHENVQAEATGPEDLNEEAAMEEKIPQIQGVAEAPQVAETPEEDQQTIAQIQGYTASAEASPHNRATRVHRGKFPLGTNLYKQVSGPIQPKVRTGRHNRGRAIFRDHGRARVLPSGLQRVPIIGCGCDFLTLEENRG